jgi:ribonuclease HI
MALYLDDGFIRAGTYDECKYSSNTIKADLIAAGVVPNVEKSIWTPTQVIDWLGMTWDAKQGSIAVTKKRVSNILWCTVNIQNNLPFVTARSLASFAGKIISLYPVIGPICQLMSRFIHHEIVKQNHWDRIFKIPGDSNIIDEIVFWKNNIVSLNNRLLFEYSLPQIIMHTDASGVGCGAQCGDMKFNQSWDSLETGKSSTWRELKGVLLALQAFRPAIREKVVKLFTDNKGVVAIISKGSMNSELQNISLEINKLCTDNHIQIDVQWIPREDNAQADLLSREIDFDDWGVSVEFFKFMDSLWGPHTIDRFADNFNAKLRRFNSKFWCSGSEHVDGFSISWAGENNWIVPPIASVPKVIKHLKVCNAKGTLVVPDWPSASFWPMLFSQHSIWKDIIHQVIRFSDASDIYVHGRNHNSMFGSNRMRSHVLCIRVNSEF